MRLDTDVYRDAAGSAVMDPADDRQLPPNIYPSRGGYRAVAKVGVHRKEKRFPSTTTLQAIRA